MILNCNIIRTEEKREKKKRIREFQIHDSQISTKTWILFIILSFLKVCFN